MPEISELSETKRALLEKYMRGDLMKAADVGNKGTEAETDRPRERIVAVQVGGSKRPFFFLHGHWQGTPFFCFPLAGELGLDQPFYALEPYQFDGLPVPPTIETMAAAHIKSMRSVQPEGPYMLGGWCNGALVAYEMARQLHAAGQRVDLLVLMDPMYLAYCTGYRLLRVMISHLGDLIGLDPDKQLDLFVRLLDVSGPLQILPHACRRLRSVRHSHSYDSVGLIINDGISYARQTVTMSIKRLARLFEHWRISPQRIAALIPTSEALRQDWPAIFEWIDRGYRPSNFYPGKITFFWPSEEPWHIGSGGWLKVIEAKEAQDVEEYILPGYQDTWRAEHLYTLAQHLRLCLSKVQRLAIEEV